MIKKLLLPALIGSVLGATSVQAGPLADLYRMALENDPQLKRAEAQFMAGQEAPVQGRAGLLPQVGFAASHTDNSAGNDTSRYGVTLRQPLFNAASYFTYKASQLRAEVAGTEFDIAQQQLILRSVEAYLDVLGAMSAVETTRAQERALQRRLDQVNAQFEVGLIAITDVQEAQASFDEAVVQRIDAEGDLDNSYEALERLVGQPFLNVVPLRADYPITGVEPAPMQEWVDKALSGNLSLRTQETELEIRRRNVQTARSGHLPSVNLELGHSQSKEHGNAQRSGWNDNNSVAVSLNLPLFSGFDTSSKRREAEHLQIASIHALDDTQREVVERTRSLLRTLQTLVQSVKAREQSIISRETALRATEEGYNVGTRNVVDVLQAEQALYQARLEYANTRIQYVKSLFQFKQVIGTLSPDDLLNLDQWLDEQNRLDLGALTHPH